MKEFTYTFFLILFFTFSANCTVIVNTELPRDYGKFGVKITGEGTKEVIVSIPQCIGGLGIKVEDGNQYTIKVNPDCTIDTPYEPLPK